MNLFCSNSYNWIFNSINYAGAILYNVWAIEEAPSNISIETSTSVTRRNPGNSFKNTSKNSHKGDIFQLYPVIFRVYYKSKVSDTPSTHQFSNCHTLNHTTRYGLSFSFKYHFLPIYSLKSHCFGKPIHLCLMGT